MEYERLHNLLLQKNRVHLTTTNAAAESDIGTHTPTHIKHVTTVNAEFLISN